MIHLNHFKTLKILDNNKITLTNNVYEYNVNITFIQKELGIGFSQANKILDELEKIGLVYYDKRQLKKYIYLTTKGERTSKYIDRTITMIEQIEKTRKGGQT